MLANKKTTILPGIFGNALEWYDFTTYAFFAPIFAAIFFPTKSPLESLLMAFGVFAASFLVRPIGAIFFGYLGDHAGRRKALIISIVVMSLPTCMLTFLPDFQTIGIAAPILLTLLRLIQGIAVSGEITSATSFLVEHSPENRRGFMGSLAMCSGFAGIVISSAVATVITGLVTHDQLLKWGWRLPFLLGGVLGFLGLWLRLHSAETEHFKKAQEAHAAIKKPTLAEHYKKLQYKTILAAILITCVMAIGNYLLIGYFNTFLIKNLGHPAKTVLFINFICLFVLTFLLPVMGSLSDKIGRKPILTMGMTGFICLIYPIFWLLQQANLQLVFIGELLFVILLSPIAALIPTTLAEMFQVHSRNSGISLGYNISLAIFGGTAPIIALSLVSVTNSYYAPAWYLIAGAVLSLLVLFQLQESYQKQLV